MQNESEVNHQYYHNNRPPVQNYSEVEKNSTNTGLESKVEYLEAFN